MLALIGVLTIATLLFFIMSKRMSPLVALIVIPVIGALWLQVAEQIPQNMWSKASQNWPRWRRCSSLRSLFLAL